MSAFKIQAPPTPVVATPQATSSSTDPAAKKKAEHAKVGRDFEAILVRQMLTQTKVAGKAGGYADMAVESLATSITSAGGLGMGKAIEQALSRSMISEHKAAPHTSALSAAGKAEGSAKEPLKPLKSRAINPNEEK